MYFHGYDGYMIFENDDVHASHERAAAHSSVLFQHLSSHAASGGAAPATLVGGGATVPAVLEALIGEGAAPKALAGGDATVPAVPEALAGEGVAPEALTGGETAPTALAGEKVAPAAALADEANCDSTSSW